MVEQFHKQAAMCPFRPFLIETTGGTLVRVSRPDWGDFPPETAYFLVWEGGATSSIAVGDVRSVLLEKFLSV
jgi:hypothetical protein